MYSSKLVCAEQAPHKHMLLSIAGSKPPWLGRELEPWWPKHFPSSAPFNQSNFDKHLSPFLHQLKAVWDWAESGRLGVEIAMSGLGGSHARSQRLLAPWLGFIRALKSYKQDKITPNRGKAGMSHEANQVKSSKVKSLPVSNASWDKFCTPVYSNNFWWAPKQHKPHSLFVCSLQLHGQFTPTAKRLSSVWEAGDSYFGSHTPAWCPTLSGSPAFTDIPGRAAVLGSVQSGALIL